MLTLYWFWSFNPQKVRFALEELGLEYSLVTVDVADGGQRADFVAKLNPVRRVPILSSGSYVLWQSNAILTYLGEETRRLWPGDAQGKGLAAKWLYFEARQLAEPIGEMWSNSYVARKTGRAPDPFAAEAAAKQSAPYLAVLNDHLAQVDWMLGENFSLVDCCYGPVLDALALAGSYVEGYPAVKAYVRKCRQRKAWHACGFVS